MANTLEGLFLVIRPAEPWGMTWHSQVNNSFTVILVQYILYVLRIDVVKYLKVQSSRLSGISQPKMCSRRERSFTYVFTSLVKSKFRIWFTNRPINLQPKPKENTSRIIRSGACIKLYDPIPNLCFMFSSYGAFNVHSNKCIPDLEG